MTSNSRKLEHKIWTEAYRNRSSYSSQIDDLLDSLERKYLRVLKDKVFEEFTVIADEVLNE